jgi:hypothetical protein
MKWGHIAPIKREGEVAAAKLIVYAGGDEQYFSFISSEAWQEVKSWMEYRGQLGVRIHIKSDTLYCS